jgi:predicted AAA+ superfamily ATPase
VKRDLEARLREWKSSDRRKPLVLRGARQVGKTWLLRSFGASDYDAVAYFNFEENRSLDQLLQGPIEPKRLLQMLSLAVGTPIVPGKTLIVFDEVQESNRALNALKYFQEEANEYHIAAAGSLLGVSLSRPASFPVGKVDFLDVHPMSFFEFLDAAGESGLRTMLEEIRLIEPVPDVLHERLIELLKIYYLTGGMPEPLATYLETNDVRRMRKAQAAILTSYQLDFAKHAPNVDIPRIMDVWRSIPAQLARENRKFMYRSVNERARSRDHGSALSWLEEARLILRAFRVSAPRHPLASYADRSTFKVYLLDVGLLGALSDLSPDILLNGDRLFTEFHGALVENYVAQQIAATSDRGLFYWSSQGTAEVDFLGPTESGVFPLEVKAGISLKSKSLLSYDAKFSPPLLSRASLRNLRLDGRILNYPLYGVPLFPGLGASLS